MSSPFSRSSLKPPSEGKPAARSSFRRTASPSPGRRSTEVPGSAGNMQGRSSSSSCGFDGDMRLKPCTAVKAEEEHQLRLLYSLHPRVAVAVCKCAGWRRAFFTDHGCRENLECCMDCHLEDAQIGRHYENAATVASKQLQTPGTSQRTDEIPGRMVLFGEGLCSFFIRNKTGSECYHPTPSCLQWSNG
ncbi:unnamed protein product, partial [Urochloa humidicola]